MKKTKHFKNMIFKLTSVVSSNGCDVKAFFILNMFARNIIHVNLEKSSMMTKLYFLLVRLFALVRLKRSICKRLSGLMVETTFFAYPFDMVHMSYPFQT